MRLQHGAAFGIGKDDVERHRSYAELTQRRRAVSVKVCCRRIRVTAARARRDRLTAHSRRSRLLMGPAVDAHTEQCRWRPSRTPIGALSPARCDGQWRTVALGAVMYPTLAFLPPAVTGTASRSGLKSRIGRCGPFLMVRWWMALFLIVLRHPPRNRR